MTPSLLVPAGLDGFRRLPPGSRGLLFGGGHPTLVLVVLVVAVVALVLALRRR